MREFSPQLLAFTCEMTMANTRSASVSESASTLEAESGYSMETQEVAQFRQHILHGHWAKAEATLTRLGVHDEASLLVKSIIVQYTRATKLKGPQEAKFLISEQKYLELLEGNKTTAALHVLRNELAPLEADSDHLHMLSRSVSQ